MSHSPKQQEWMSGFLQALKFQSAAPQLIGDDESAGIVQKLQKNVCMSLTLYATKYDEEFSSFLEGFVQVEIALSAFGFVSNPTFQGCLATADRCSGEE